MNRYPTPPPIATLDYAFMRLDVLGGEVESLARDVAELREKLDNFRDESIRNDSIVRGLTKDIESSKHRIEDQGQAIHALRRREAQLVILGALAAIFLTVIMRQLLGR